MLTDFYKVLGFTAIVDVAEVETRYAELKKTNSPAAISKKKSQYERACQKKGIEPETAQLQQFEEELARAQREFPRITEAYEMLSTPKSKDVYDQYWESVYEGCVSETLARHTLTAAGLPNISDETPEPSTRQSVTATIPKPSMRVFLRLFLGIILILVVIQVIDGRGMWIVCTFPCLSLGLTYIILLLHRIVQIILKWRSMPTA